MPARHVATAAVLLTAVAVGCGGGGAAPRRADQRPPARPAATRAATPPAPDAPLPARAAPLAVRMRATDAALRRELRRWSPRTQPPPRAVTLYALDLQRAVRMLARRPRLAAATIPRLSDRPRLRRFAQDASAAVRDLRRLAAGWPVHELRVGAAEPLPRLEAHFAEARRRFGVGEHVLAAVNLVESEFGRLRNASVAGAQGPMQFIPATWAAYGMGGDIRDPHDAILGAANLLRANGAPRSYARALHAYNPSGLYVEAVLRLAGLIRHDRDALPILYAFQVYTPLPGGRERRLTGPGLRPGEAAGR